MLGLSTITMAAGLNRWLMAAMLILIGLLAVQSCADSAVGPAAAKGLELMPSHPCHLFGEVDWVTAGTVTRMGLSPEYGSMVLVIALEDGCQCQVFVAEWTANPSLFPKHRRLVLQGVEIGAPGTDRHVLVLVDVLTNGDDLKL